MTDLITSLRALAAARHDDLSIAVDAVIEIERLRKTNKQLVEGIDTITRRKQEEIERLRAALQEFACSCSSLGECESTWDLDGECRYLTARKALEGKP